MCMRELLLQRSLEYLSGPGVQLSLYSRATSCLFLVAKLMSDLPVNDSHIRAGRQSVLLLRMAEGARTNTHGVNTLLSGHVVSTRGIILTGAQF
jgi:hypothetical protein